MNNRSWADQGGTEAIVVDGTAKSASDTATRLDPAERRLLAGMPLHAITSVHGEAGLRERLLIEIAKFPAADRARTGEALALASQLHARDRRQREPYANHYADLRIMPTWRGEPQVGGCWRSSRSADRRPSTNCPDVASLVTECDC
jgi:hypothetical protein